MEYQLFYSIGNKEYTLYDKKTGRCLDHISGHVKVETLVKKYGIKDQDIYVSF